MVSRSVHTGTCRDQITVPRPIRTPSARRYMTYSGEPENMAAARLDRMSVLTIQNRT